MRIKLIQHKDDFQMVELWTRFEGGSMARWQLAAVMHEDNFLGTPIYNELIGAREAGDSLPVYGELIAYSGQYTDREAG